mmetsp:Transcript_4844/g.11927  ORF Transcript_4844/g.11927 Transcript_4844/m.11927 type:complete len:221 (-) Transcript_4844:1196-1858(-)
MTSRKTSSRPAVRHFLRPVLKMRIVQLPDHHQVPVLVLAPLRARDRRTAGPVEQTGRSDLPQRSVDVFRDFCPGSGRTTRSTPSRGICRRAVSLGLQGSGVRSRRPASESRCESAVSGSGGTDPARRTPPREPGASAVPRSGDLDLDFRKNGFLQVAGLRRLHYHYYCLLLQQHYLSSQRSPPPATAATPLAERSADSPPCSTATIGSTLPLYRRPLPAG